MIRVDRRKQRGASKEISNHQSQEEADQAHKELGQKEEKLRDQLLQGNHAQGSRSQKDERDADTPESQPAQKLIGRWQRSLRQDRGQIGALKKLIELDQRQEAAQDDLKK